MSFPGNPGSEAAPGSGPVVFGTSDGPDPFEVGVVVEDDESS